MKPEFILDASALLTILLDERGLDRVTEILDRSRMHGVNLAEVIGRLVRGGMPAEEAAAAIAELHLDIEEEFGAAEATFCGALLGSTRAVGLSLGDCICLTTAVRAGAIAVTADRRWKLLDGSAVGGEILRIELVR